MKVDIKTQVSVCASAAEVFMYLANLQFVHLWNPQLRHVSTRKQLKLHSVYETETVILGISIKSINTVTKYVKNKEIQIENTTGTVQYHVRFEINDTSNPTVLLKCFTSVSSENTAFAFTKPVLKVLARRKLQTDLQALKIAVENKLT